ncbi:cell wall-binding repeat-containing protein [Clostridium cochlearium]|uniref:cell wall-binding repeat-containing protein n=1 Tax=Clostridium cochlearium TaxID=1494 RepID=UPI0022E39FA1|nr:cell wall-binding repeat-containing protein [Clostridium cochlearium]
MSKNSHKALASATVMSLVLTSTLAATNVQAAAEVTRMPGADRYTTAQTVAKKSFGKAENVVLVNGLGYADSVSATPFAKLKNAPILLTDAEDKPSADLLATLTELGAKNIYIVGGKGVVTEAMEKELAKNYTVERIGGTSRYETNAEIAKKVIAETKAEKAILVNGQDGYADALSVASVAATKGYPVIFGNKNNVPTVVKDAVKDVKEILAVGGEGVLPDAVIKTVEAKRIAKGADRFDTNLKVLEHFDGDFNFENIFVAAGGDDSTSKFADALVASAAAAKHGAPVVLTGLGANKDNVDKSVKYVKDKMGDNTKVTIVGGTASVSDAIEKDIKGEKESTGKAEVQSIEALNLNQVKIVFADKVDEDTAEDIRNYEIDGTQFTKEDADNKKAIAVLQDDDKTVILTLAKSESQEKEKEVKVRKGVLTEDKKKLVSEKEMKVTFKDTKAPTVKKVEVKGNSKLTIEFSEAVLVNGDDPVNTLAEQIEINGNTIKSIGYNDDEEYSKLKDYVKDGSDYYTNKVQFYFDSALDNGTNKLTVPDGDKDGGYLVDVAGFAMKEADIDFKVEEVTSRPKVKSVKGSTDGKIYINFDRAMDEKTVKEGTYKLNSNLITIGDNDAKVELKEGDTQIKLSSVENILTGSNTIEVGNKVRDAYGNKVEDDLRVSFNASKDEAKPKVTNVLTVDDSTIRVVFDKDVSKSSADNIKNYTLRDSKGSKVSLKSKITPISDSIYDIHLDGSKLDGSKYTLKIESISDLAGNVMDEKTVTINGEDITPEVKHAIKVNEKDKNGKEIKNKVVVVFESEMKASSINKLDNYKYKNGKGDVKSLPSDTKVTVESDNKTVTIEFPTSYTIYAEEQNVPSESNAVKNIIVTKNVQSANGIKMDADETVRIKDSDGVESSVSLDEEPMVLREDKGNAVVSVKFDGAVKKAEFTKKDGAVEGVKFFDKENNKDAKDEKQVVYPMNITTNGEKVEFKFNDDDSDKIKAMGVDLAIKIEEKALRLTDAAGVPITLNADKLKGIDKNEIAPEIIYEKDSNDYVKANDKEEFKSWEFNRVDGTVTIKFNTKLREGCADINDFDFTGDKGKLEVQKATVKDNTVIYEFKNDDKEAFKDSKELKVKLNKDKQTIESKSDKNGDRIDFDKDSIGNETLKVKLGEYTAAEKESEKEEQAAVNEEAAKITAEGIKNLADKANVLDQAKELVGEGFEVKITNSENTAIDTNGVVTQPEKSSGEKSGNVTFEVSKDGKTATKTVNLTVAEKDA